MKNAECCLDGVQFAKGSLPATRVWRHAPTPLPEALWVRRLPGALQSVRPNQSRQATRFAMMAQDAFKTARSGSKTAQNGLRIAQDALKRAQEGSKGTSSRAQEGSKGASSWARRRAETLIVLGSDGLSFSPVRFSLSSRWLKKPPVRPQDHPRGPQEAPRGHQDGLKIAQYVSKRIPCRPQDAP